MKISVQDADIYNARRRKGWRCPVEEAIEKTTHLDACVTRFRAIVDGRSFDLPETVTAFVDDFDGGFAVEPFSFDLSLESLLCPAPTNATTPR